MFIRYNHDNIQFEVVFLEFIYMYYKNLTELQQDVNTLDIHYQNVSASDMFLTI